MSESQLTPRGALSRRRFLTLGAGMAAASFTPLGMLTARANPIPSWSYAYSYLARMQDLYLADSTPRLLQSYSGSWTSAYVYDNALALLAFIAHGDLPRARVIGDAFLAALQYDSTSPGRLRNAYDATTSFAGGPVTGVNLATTTGNMAWAGIALTKLYAATSISKYRLGAQAIGLWIALNTFDTSGKGFTGGLSSSGTKYAWKSTEHNIDVYAFFRLLAAASQSLPWSYLAQSARSFVTTMWNPQGGHFWTGDDGASPTPNTNHYPIPEDVQTWSYLALQDPAYASSIDWAITHLAATDSAGGIAVNGVSVSNADTSGVWFEGTAHLTSALFARDAAGDRDRVGLYLGSLVNAQLTEPYGDRQGIAAASRPLNTGEGDVYPVTLHVGTTAWAYHAFRKINPFAP